MHHNHKILHYILKNKTLSEFYFMVGMRQFAYSLISVFLPIYIFLLRNSLLDVLIFLFFTYISIIFLFPIVGKINSKFGNVHTILLSSPLMVIFFYILQNFDPLITGLPILGFLFALFQAFFWMPFHEEFSFISKSKEMGKELSLVRLTFSSAGIMAPFLGSLIIVLFGFDLLFLVVLLIAIIGALPLLFSKEVKPKQKFNLKLAFSKKYRTLFLPFVGNGVISTSNEWLWPILMFLILGNFVEIGSFAMIINLFAVLVLIFLMAKTDKINKEKLLKIGTIIFSLSIMIRAFIRTFLGVISVWSLGAISFIIFSVPFESKIYEKSKHLNKLEYFVVREWSISIGRLIILFIALIFSYDIYLSLTAGIFTAGILTFFTLKL